MKELSYLVDLTHKAKCGQCGGLLDGIFPDVAEQMGGTLYKSIERLTPCESCGGDLATVGYRINPTTRIRRPSELQLENAKKRCEH